MKYDEALQRLEKITALLNTNVSFEEGAKLFAEGVELVKFCSDELNKRRGEFLEIKRNFAGVVEIEKADDDRE